MKAISFTHLHMDHTTDDPSILLCGYGAGIGTSPDPNVPAVPVQVYGPGNRGQLAKDLYKLHVVLPRHLLGVTGFAGQLIVGEDLMQIPVG